MLDSTLVLLCTDVARVGTASYGPLPLLLAGRAGRNITGGRFMRYSRRPHNDSRSSIYNLFGGGADSFGTRTTGPLPGLFVVNSALMGKSEHLPAPRPDGHGGRRSQAEPPPRP